MLLLHTTLISLHKNLPWYKCHWYLYSNNEISDEESEEDLQIGIKYKIELTTKYYFLIQLII